MKMKNILAAAFFFLWGSVALAQTSPNLIQDQKLTPAQWNALFAAKQDYLGAPPLLTTGGTMSGKLSTVASSAVIAGLNVPPGVAPTSPLDGDIWSTTSGLFVQINGSTVGPLSSAAAGSFTATTPIVVSFPGGGVTNFACATCGVTGRPLSQFAATTSAQLAGVISDGTGTGPLVFGTNASLTTPNIGVATATSINKLTITAPATSAVLTIPNGVTLTGPSASGTAATLANAETLTNKTLTSPAINAGALSGTFTGTPTFNGALTFSGGPLFTGGLTVSSSFTATGLVTFADLASAAVATGSQFLSGASSVVVPASVIYQAETATTFGATTTFDFSTFINTAVTLTGNITTQTLSNVKAGQAGQIRFIQDGSGSRTTVWNGVFKFVNGVTPTLTTTPGAIDVLFYSCASSSLCYASLSANMK